jgi:hypothetical protein
VPIVGLGDGEGDGVEEALKDPGPPARIRDSGDNLKGLTFPKSARKGHWASGPRGPEQSRQTSNRGPIRSGSAPFNAKTSEPP